jgi:predicted enzyme related to lactoylglutathione lyase
MAGCPHAARNPSNEEIMKMSHWKQLVSASGMATAEGVGVYTDPRRVVHLELHTGDLAEASAFYEQLLGWRRERIEARCGSYHALGLGGEVDGGIVECATTRPLWVPYVEVERIGDATERARELGAAVLLKSREGPTGWRSVVSSPAGGEVALWQPKDWR